VPLPAHTQALQTLLGPGCGWLIGAALLAMLTIPLCLFAGAAYAPLALIPAALGLLVAVFVELLTQRRTRR
jgi:hypothetical protein